MLNNDPKILEAYSRDASIFKVMPKYVAFPKSSDDIKKLVEYAKTNGESLTVRAAGTDMTGGPLNESIIVDVTKHMNQIGEITGPTCVVEPGVFYRDFEKKTLEKGWLLPCYPASKDLCALGGMIANNCGGEKSLRYGKMENFIVESKWIFSDGNEYVIRPGAIDNKYSEQIFELIKANYELIQKARPRVAKNSAGYYLWNVWDGKTFDLNKLLVGSQGTLGIMTEATIRLVKVKPCHDMIALFFKSWDELPQVINALLPFEPESLETFDEETLKLGIRFMPEIARKTGSSVINFALKFLPEAWIGVKMLRLPKLIVLVEVAEDTEEEVKAKVKEISKAVEHFSVWSRVIEKDSEEEKFWVMRRESFNFLRKHVGPARHGFTVGESGGDKRTVPFIEDFCIPVEKIPEFLPKAKKILEDNGINVNIAGHAGEGNFHIIPLMDLTKESERAKITRVAGLFYDLVAEYRGTITGEHNDGIIRTPYLNKMYSPEILALFKKVKQIFDPTNIFNPGKKVGGNLEYLNSHISTT
ncbi:MAG: FAD-binding oxidoreductase [Candidatus Zambryskibacteria bacterium]|nr:FAD-binding oxidoreductase [Candidatus Zambryskibacteria bacterium]